MKKNKTTRRNKKRNKRTRKKRIIGGVRTYTLEGAITEDPGTLHNGKDFFRKMTDNQSEVELCKLLMKNPHKNIIKMYHVGNTYIDMELLNIDMDNQDNSKIIKAMTDAKAHLQSLGIIYIDWKLDNIGVSDDGEIKLFDFDCSGLIDLKTKEWLIEPPKYWAYKNAIKNGMKTPIETDNYAFTQLNQNT